MAADIFSVAGRVCLVTGASSGLGAHFARVLARAGAKVAGASHVDPGEDDACVLHVDCDIRDPQTVTDTFDKVEAKLGPVDVLVNVAGIAVFGRSEEVDDEALVDLFNVNVAGTMRVTHEAVRRMRARRRGGSIIHVTSVLARKTTVGVSAYAGSKAAVEQMMRTQAAEWARHRIRVNALAPGWFPTEMTRPHFDKGADQVLKARIPMRRLGEPGDLDGALLLLASDASRYMTGSVVTVDGGYCVGV